MEFDLVKEYKHRLKKQRKVIKKERLRELEEAHLERVLGRPLAEEEIDEVASRVAEILTEAGFNKEEAAVKARVLIEDYQERTTIL